VLGWKMKQNVSLGMQVEVSVKYYNNNLSFCPKQVGVD
jgi:hypothetical protein